MRAALLIAARDLRGLFVSPLAWVILAVLQAAGAWVFLVRLDVFAALQPRLLDLPGAPGLTALVVTPLLQALAQLLIVLVPVVTMRQLAAERREGTLVLLLSAPVSAASIVLGKFLATVAFFCLALALLCAMPLLLLLGGTLDAGLLAAALLGMVLAVALFVAAGLFASACTAQPATAAIAGVGLLTMLWMLDWAATPGDGQDFSLLAWLSPASHLEPLLRGLVDTADLAWFALAAAAFLVLAVYRVEGMRSWD